MEHPNLENAVNEKISLLEKSLTPKEKQDFHFKSIKNFAIHLFKNKPNSKIESSRLKKINLKRNQELILEYLDLIIDKKVSSDDSVSLFKNYIEKIGEFMNRNFGFSFAGGKLKFLRFLISATIGAVIDLSIWVFTDNLSCYFTIAVLLYSIIRAYIKLKNNKLFGPNF